MSKMIGMFLLGIFVGAYGMSVYVLCKENQEK